MIKKAKLHTRKDSEKLTYEIAIRKMLKDINK